MAYFTDFSSPTAGLILFAGIVTIPKNGGAPTDTVPQMSASLLSTGLHRMTLQDPYLSLVTCQLTLQNTGSQHLRVEVSGSNVGNVVDFTQASGTKVLDFRVMSGSNPVNPQNDVKVHFLAFVKQSVV